MTYLPFLALFFIVYLLVLAGAFVYLQFFVVTTAFETIGIAPEVAVLVLLLSLLFSTVNIPLFRLKSKVPIDRRNLAEHFGMKLRVPSVGVQRETIVAVNVGGAMIPLVLSVYLLIVQYQIIVPAIAATAVLSYLVYQIAKPVKGAGIMVPLFIPPVVAALLAVLFTGGEQAPVVAYIAGSLGTLIGADLMNLQKIPELGSPVVSIGGAGTFDGVFLTGIVAVLLASI